MKEKTASALRWIVEILNKHHISYQIAGGFIGRRGLTIKFEFETARPKYLVSEVCRGLIMSNMVNKVKAVATYCIPIVVMIGLIPFVSNDYLLIAIYILFTIALLFIKSEKNDLLAFLFGLVGITISEAFFVSTGVETFLRHSLFGLMPIWLPLLWAYAFVTIKRSLRILDK